MKQKTQKIVVAGIVGVVVLGYFLRGHIRDAVSDVTKSPVPSAMPYPSSTPTSQTSTTPKPSATSSAGVNLDIPFVSQAPEQIWDADHEEFCEEAAVLMAASYITGDRTVLNVKTAEADLQSIKSYEMATFGYFKDTTAAETARILTDHLHIAKVKIVQNPTETTIKSFLLAGKAVLVPSAGRELGNPNFKAPGPLYHMIVLKGYTKAGTFISNDPGTRKGADYLYSPSVIMNAMHDWNGGDVTHGAKVVIVVG